MAKSALVPDRTPESTSPKPLDRPLKVAWFSYFPIEWLPDLPPELQGLPRLHPATWQRVLWEELKARKDLQLDIIVLRSHFRQSHSFERDGTTFHCIRTPPGLRAASLYWLDTILVRRKLKQIRPDVVHAWGSEFGAISIATRLNYPALVTMQGILTWYGSVFPLNRHMKLSRFLEDRSLPKARVVTAESSFGIRYLKDRYPNLSLRQVEHAPHPAFARITRKPPSEIPRIICVGSFLYWKGADVVFKALDALTASTLFQLVWIGAKNAELEKTIRSETTPALWDRVEFKHQLTPPEVVEEMSRATILVHAARVDNSPNSVKEAVVAGLPVVATETGGIPDYVHPGKNGFLFRSGDWEDCREKVKQALAHPLLAKGEVEAQTLAAMREYLSAQTMGQKFYSGYQAALEAYRRY